VQAVSAAGNWVAFCQARADSDGDGKVEVKIGPRGELGGDALSGFLGLPNGETLDIDDLVSSDLAGKYVIYVRGGRTLLADVERGTVLDLETLGADTRRDALRYRPHRSLALDAEGRHLLYVKRPNGKAAVVVGHTAANRDDERVACARFTLGDALELPTRPSLLASYRSERMTMQRTHSSMPLRSVPSSGSPRRIAY